MWIESLLGLSVLPTIPPMNAKTLEVQEAKKTVETMTRAIRREPSDINYGQRAEAYLRLREYANALADLHCAEAAKIYTTNAFLIRIGLVHWLSRRE